MLNKSNVLDMGKKLLNQLFPNKALAIVAIILMLLGGNIFFFGEFVKALEPFKYPIQVTGVALVAIGYFALVRDRSLWSILDTTSKFYLEALKAAQQKVDKEPEKAKPAWDLARITLEAYFNKNLSQINNIFILSLFVMLVGFGFVLYGIWLVFQNPQNISPAIIAGVAGIISQFIGATFLLIYRSTIEQAANYTKTLERINSVGMAMQILDTTTESVNQAQLTEPQQKVLDAKIEIAKLLLKQGQDKEPSVSGKQQS